MTVSIRATTPAPIAIALAAACCLLLSAVASYAQDMPYVDAVGAFNHANVMTRPEAEAERKAPDPRPSQQAGQTISRQQMDEILAELQIGYRERLERDGKPSADAWLEDTVDQLRRRYKSVE